MIVRERTLESIIIELHEINRTYPNVSYIRILDDLFLKSISSIENAIKIFSPFKFKWRSMAHIMSFKSVNTQTLKLLKKSGCIELFIGIESGSRRILKDINKTYNPDTIKSVLKKIFLSGITVKGYFILGFPGETEYNIKETYELAVELEKTAKLHRSTFRISVFQFRPYHGTSLFQRIFKDEKTDNNIIENDSLTQVIGRREFNFNSGNYSECSDTVLNDYLKKMNDLNKIE
jgi:radical SAM superfamily enzyme YgiQ (UPF0313 family)